MLAIKCYSKQSFHSCFFINATEHRVQVNTVHTPAVKQHPNYFVSSGFVFVFFVWSFLQPAAFSSVSVICFTLKTESSSVLKALMKRFSCFSDTTPVKVARQDYSHIPYLFVYLFNVSQTTSRSVMCLDGKRQMDKTLSCYFGRYKQLGSRAVKITTTNKRQSREAIF